MRIGRTIIIPAILALGVAGAVLAGSEISTVAAHAPSTRAQVTVTAASPEVLYHN
jgi:hypothetical protein